MILIADSGSTKTDWTNGTQFFQTKGLSPVFLDADRIAAEVLPNVPSWCDPEKVEEIYFYGTGCSTPERNLRVSNGIRQVFPKATIHVEHDMLGAARSVCQQESGLVAILGTGANCCFFDGKLADQRTPSLGFILGDEGSGADIGKHLVIQYFYGRLNTTTKEAFEDFLGDSATQLIELVYRNPLPNRFLASLVPFVATHLSEDIALETLVRERFSAFFENHVLIYKPEEREFLNAVGSIAFIMQPLLQEVAETYGTKLNHVIKNPINGLIQFHSLKHEL